MLVSGGVDSTVCAALLHKALSDDQVIALHIDNGFMRKNESLQVEQSLRKLGLKLKGNKSALSPYYTLSLFICIYSHNITIFFYLYSAHVITFFMCVHSLS